jgi:CIC family chloride channel protein
VLIDEQGHYAGIVQTASAYREDVLLTAAIGTLAIHRERALLPDADIRSVMASFDVAGADELAIVENNGAVLGLLSETYVRRRYAEELDKSQREMFGER